MLAVQSLQLQSISEDETEYDQIVVQIGPWEQWLARGMESPDCKLSSHAARAWLHLQAARAAAAPAASSQVVATCTHLSLPQIPGCMRVCAVM